MSYNISSINGISTGGGMSSRISQGGVLPRYYNSAPNIVIATPRPIKNYRPAGIKLSSSSKPSQSPPSTKKQK